MAVLGDGELAAVIEDGHCYSRQGAVALFYVWISAETAPRSPFNTMVRERAMVAIPISAPTASKSLYLKTPTTLCESSDATI